MLMRQLQNAAAGVLAKTRRADHISPVLRSLHWPPVCQRTDFKTLRCYTNKFAMPHPKSSGEGRELVKDGHSHDFTVKFGRTDRKDYPVDCDQPRSVLEVIKSTERYKKKMKKCSDENIVIQLGEEDRESIVATHFPCSCIGDGEILIISCESKMVEKVQDQHDKTIHSRENYSVFYIDTVGGQNAKSKTLFRNKVVKQFKFLCVYGEKGMTVEEALKRDGRFIDDLGDFTLSDNEKPDSITERTRKVDKLDNKRFKLCLERNKRANDENPVLDVAHQRHQYLKKVLDPKTNDTVCQCRLFHLLKVCICKNLHKLDITRKQMCKLFCSQFK